MRKHKNLKVQRANDKIEAAKLTKLMKKKSREKKLTTKEITALSNTSTKSEKET